MGEEKRTTDLALLSEIPVEEESSKADWGNETSEDRGAPRKNILASQEGMADYTERLR